ncbi:hypothetical protein ASG54_11055 [Aureimonas sp. Leaf460]|nr:hypothetical protein ASG62_15355 [Aureimonas sp. Leaf427]KQT77520.1 hypothetical protein ASG54_11055 [Aureimonas sp. Leaf460]
MMRFGMVILLAAADVIRREKGARPQQTRRAGRPRTKSFGPRLERSAATSIAMPLDLGTRTAGRMTIPNLIMLNQ